MSILQEGNHGGKRLSNRSDTPWRLTRTNGNPDPGTSPLTGRGRTCLDIAMNLRKNVGQIVSLEDDQVFTLEYGSRITRSGQCRPCVKIRHRDPSVEENLGIGPSEFSKRAPAIARNLWKRISRSSLGRLPPAAGTGSQPVREAVEALEAAGASLCLPFSDASAFQDLESSRMSMLWKPLPNAGG